jgi:hypothetical protein
VKAKFIEPMLLLRTSTMPEGDEWSYEIKWDGYRAVAFKTAGKVHLRSRKDNDFLVRYPGVMNALAGLPDDTVIDGEIVALDETGRPSFNVLHNYGSSQPPVLFYVFDVLVLNGTDVRRERLDARRKLLANLLRKLKDPIRESAVLDASLGFFRTASDLKIVRLVRIRELDQLIAVLRVQGNARVARTSVYVVRLLRIRVGRRQPRPVRLENLADIRERALLATRSTECAL